MSRSAIVVTLAAYFVVAFAFGLVLETTKPPGAGESIALFVVNALETGVLTFVASGILPFGYWAFRRFRSVRIDGLLFVWGVLGVAYMILYGTGTFWHQKIAISHPPEAATPLTDDAHADDVHDRFVKSINTGCVANQERSASEQHSDITKDQIIAYCRCFAEAIAKEMTTADIMDIAKSGKLSASFEEKADKVTPMCTRLALGH